MSAVCLYTVMYEELRGQVRRVIGIVGLRRKTLQKSSNSTVHQDIGSNCYHKRN